MHNILARGVLTETDLLWCTRGADQVLAYIEIRISGGVSARGVWAPPRSLRRSHVFQQSREALLFITSEGVSQSATLFRTACECTCKHISLPTLHSQSLSARCRFPLWTSAARNSAAQKVRSQTDVVIRRYATHQKKNWSMHMYFQTAAGSYIARLKSGSQRGRLQTSRTSHILLQMV